MIKQQAKKQEQKLLVMKFRTRLLKSRGYKRWLSQISGLSGRFSFLAFWLVVFLNPLQVAAQTPPGSSAPTAGQSATGSISGRISNGTAGAATPSAGQEVKLERFTQGSENAEESKAVTNSDGNFVFQKLPAGENYTYYVSTLYAGVTYYAQAEVKLTAIQPSQTAELKIYETSSDPSLVSIAGTSLVIPQVDATSGLISVLEMYSIQNKSDHTFISSNKNRSASSSLSSAQPTPTLRFFLPTGATGISPAAGLNPGDIVETSDGIEVTSAVLPGESQMVFSYQLSYQGETFSFNKRLAYDTPSLRFFTPLGGPKATSSQLVVGQPMQMGQQQLAVLTSRNLKANDQLRIELSGLPLPPNQSIIASRDTVLKLMIAVLMVVLIGILVVYSRRKPGTVASSSPDSATSVFQNYNAENVLGDKPDSKEAEPEPERKRRRLVYQLAKLDNNFAKAEPGQDETDYRERRTQLMSQLLELWPDTTTIPAKEASLSAQVPKEEPSSEGERKVTG